MISSNTTSLHCCTVAYSDTKPKLTLDGLTEPSCFYTTENKAHQIMLPRNLQLFAVTYAPPMAQSVHGMCCVSYSVHVVVSC